MPFPQQLLLNGIDHFLYQLDSIMRRSSGKSNTCTFVITLDQPVSTETLNTYLLTHPVYCWISSLRLKHPGIFSLTRWQVKPDTTPTAVTEYSLTDSEELPESLIGQSIDPHTDAPFKVDSVQTDLSQTLLVFSWHHALMDAHGAEMLIQLLGDPDQINNTEWLKTLKPRTEDSLRERLKKIQGTKTTLYETSKYPFLSLQAKETQASTLRYTVLRFTREETLAIEKNARQQGAGFLISAFHLAATARAIAHVYEQHTGLNKDMVIPVPQDRRKRGTREALLGNQVTFLFYRIPHAALTSLKRCTQTLVQQITHIMRGELSENYLVMMSMIQRIPGPLYRLLLKSPTQGRIASFLYSDTGDSLQGFTHFLHQSVRSALHYPPNIHPPGVTFIYSKFRGQLQITLSTMEEILDDSQLARLISHLRSDLLSEEIA